MCHVMMGGVTRCDDGWSNYMCYVIMGGMTRCVMMHCVQWVE